MYYLKICSTFETAYFKVCDRIFMLEKKFKNILDVLAGSPQSGSEHAAACNICHFSVLWLSLRDVERKRN